jgi:hypothetical protein
MSNHDIFDTFIQAKQALDRLPELEAAHVQHEETIAALKAAITQRDELELDQRRELADLKAKLSETEVALEDSRFRELEISDRFETLVGGMRSALGKAEPKVEPQPVASASAYQAPDDVALTTDERQRMETDRRADDLWGQSEASPTSSSASPSDVTASGEHAGSTDVSTGPGNTLEQGQPEPMVNPPSQWGALEQGPTPSIHQQGQSEAGPTVTTGGMEQRRDDTEGQSVFHPTATHSSESAASSPSAPLTNGPFISADPSFVDPSVSAPQEVRHDDRVSLQPFRGRPHWVKPAHLGWKEWADGGGELPHWLREVETQ